MIDKTLEIVIVTSVFIFMVCMGSLALIFRVKEKRDKTVKA
jgi:hypothetical protein